MSTIVIRDVTVLDGTGSDPVTGRDVIVEDGRISAVQATGNAVAADIVIDGGGATLLPGLIDAHVHFALVGSTTGMPGEQSYIEHVLAVRALIEKALLEGFTTVRDAGGLEPDVGPARRCRPDPGTADPAVGWLHHADRRPRRLPDGPRGGPPVPEHPRAGGEPGSRGRSGRRAASRT